MIVLITLVHEDEKTGRKQILVSHGVDANLRGVPLPQVPPHEIGLFDGEIGEWVLREPAATPTAPTARETH